MVLDNFEHLLDAAPLLAQLLAVCPRLALLVTSRAALRLRPERRFLVAPLATPTLADEPSLVAVAATPAVQLFLERAQNIAPDLVLEAANAPSIAAICRRLDGMPLAIELAAARAAVLQAEALLQRLERRLPLLTGGAADLPERLRTLRASLAWSHDLLGSGEQALFRRLAVFAGAGHWRRRRRSAGVLNCQPRMYSSSYAPWWTPAWSTTRVEPKKGRASACWRPSASMRWSGWKQQVRP
jgi:predicted ATPase